MTPNDIRTRIEQIKFEGKIDPEKGHIMEDHLYEDVLLEIADHARDPKGLANAALKTKELTFPRWCS